MANTTAQLPPGYLEETRQPQIYRENIVLIVLTTTIVALRFVSRRISRISWKFDDTMIFLGWASFTIFASVFMADTRYGGVGLHQIHVMQIDKEMLTTWAKYFIVIAEVYAFAVYFPKFAVISLYISIFSTSRAVRISSYISGAIIICNFITCTVILSTICIPLKKFWDPAVPGHCIANVNDLIRWGRIVNIVSDVIMLAIPIPKVLKLQMTIRMKMGLLLTFSVGIFGLIAAIITIWEVAHTDAADDNTWPAYVVVLWSEIEAAMYLITASLLAYKPLLKFLGHRIMRCFRPPSPTNPTGFYFECNSQGPFFVSKAVHKDENSIELLQPSRSQTSAIPSRDNITVAPSMD